MAVPAAARLLPPYPGFVPAFVGVSLLLLAAPRAAMALSCPVTMSACANTDLNDNVGSYLTAVNSLSRVLCQTYTVLSGKPVWSTDGSACYAFVCKSEFADSGTTSGNPFRCPRFSGCSILITRSRKCPGLSKAGPPINGHYQCCCPPSAMYPIVATVAGRSIFTGCVPNGAVWV